MLDGMSDITRILNAAEQGDHTVAEELLPLVYTELRKLAAFRMANEAPGQTLQPTALPWLTICRDSPLTGPTVPVRFQVSSLSRGRAAR